MSALAARRAAQAKLKAAAPAASVAVKAPAPPREPTPPPSPTPSISESESEIEVEIEAPASKKRRVNKKGKEAKEEKGGEKAKKKKGRFFAPEPEEEPAPKARRKRAYSPGLPLPSDDSSGDDGDDGDDASSDDEGMLFDGTATPALWSTAPSPGPDMAQRLSNAQLRPYTSEFQPREGVNFVKLKSGALPAALGPGPAVAVSLAEGETLAIVGTYSLVPLQHAISLLSTTLRPAEDDIESYPVFAPTCHPVPVITPAINRDQLACSPVLEDIKLPKAFLRDASRALFLLREHRTGIDGLSGDVVPGFNNIWASDKGAWGLAGVHPVTTNFVPVYAHTTPPSWADALASLEQAPRSDDSDDDDTPPDRIPVVVVKGPKRSGKSSLARAALNRLLEDFARVAWLECDLGQGEFGPGGTVGLWILDAPVLGPPFTHPRAPARATYLGELSPQPCPDAYMAAVHSALQHYQYEVQYPPSSMQAPSARRTDVVPLVVNTQGWTRGLGEELMRAIEVASEPTHVFGFDAGPLEHDASIVHAGGNIPSSPAQIFSVAPAPASPLLPRYSAADMRALALLSYMYSLEGRWDVSAPLFAHRPWTVTLGDGPLRRAFLIGEGAEGVSPSDLPLALNGSLVALLEAPDADAWGSESAYEPGSTPPEEATALGLALVRAVRVDAGQLQLQLLTPLPASTLARASALVRNGALELPPAGTLDWRARVPGGGVPDEGLAGVRWDDVPFFEGAGSGVVGGDRRRFRKNLQRKNQQ